MSDRKRSGSVRRWLGILDSHGPARRGRRPRIEDLEGRQLLATIAALPDITPPANLGQVVPVNGGTSPQQFAVSSSNPDVKATVINGPTLSLDVSHASSGAGDPAFNGTLTFQLFQELTPTTVNRILSLVNQGFYTSPTTNPDPTFTNLPDKNFHRIASGFPDANGFIVQGGSPNGNGTGDINQPGFPFADEFKAPLAFTGAGQLAMANAGDDTNSSQFFITTSQPGFLDFQHTIFGQLVEGSNILQQMTQVSRDSMDSPVSPILITGTRVNTTSPDGALLIDTTSATAGESAQITVTASMPSDGSTATQTFNVNVAANTANQRPFLNPVATNQVTPPGQPAQIQLSAVSTNPGDQLTYGVGGGTASDGTFAPVQNATATVDANGLVTVTPNAGYTGLINLVVGVRDQSNPSNASDINAVSNYDTQKINLTVTTNTPPTATPVTASTQQNQAITVQLAGDTGNPDSSQTLTYALTSNPVNGTISNFNAQTGTLTYTPNTNFMGTDSFTFNVTDVGAPSPNVTSQDATASLTVSAGQAVNQPPTAQSQQVTVQANTPASVQLNGTTGDPNSSQTLTYALDTSQTQGTVTNFDASTGAFTYTPPINFTGTDTLTFTTTDVGPPTPNLTSQPATVTFNVIGAVDTGAVRQIGTVLLVTPQPGKLINPTPNVIAVTLVNGRIVTSINGRIDTLQPNATDLERVVVYGTKASDVILIAPDVPLLSTLDGGLGGKNQIESNNLPSRLHGWYGRNNLTGGTAHDALIGRQGHVRFHYSGGNDTVFAGEPNIAPILGDHSNISQGQPPHGQFFRFIKQGHLVPIPTPPPVYSGKFLFADSTSAKTTQPASSQAARLAAAEAARAARIQQIQQRRHGS